MRNSKRVLNRYIKNQFFESNEIKLAHRKEHLYSQHELTSSQEDNKNLDQAAFKSPSINEGKENISFVKNIKFNDKSQNVMDNKSEDESFYDAIYDSVVLIENDEKINSQLELVNRLNNTLCN